MLLITACAADPEGSGSSTTTQPGATTTSSSAGTTTTPPAATTTVSGVPPTLPDIPLVPRSELPDDFPEIPVPAGGTAGTIGSFEGESVSFEYPPGTLATLVAFYEAWFRTQNIDPGPRFGSDPSRYWEVMVDGMRVKFELYTITNKPGDRLFIIYYP